MKTKAIAKKKPTKLLKIEKGIKVPPVALNREPSYPSAVAITLLALEKRDSFLVKGELEALKAAKVLSGTTKRERARGGSREFTSRKVRNGLRIWRTA